MKQLAEGIGWALAGLYGQENTFLGRATKDAVIPYVQYEIELAIPTIRSTCSWDVNTQYAFPVRISVVGRDYSFSEGRSEEIIAWFQTNDINVGKHKLDKTSILSRQTFEGVTREDSAERVWVGEMVFEFLVTKGA